MKSSLLEVAMSQYGVREFVGKQDNPEVLKYFDAMGLDGERLKDETSWCSAFVNWCAIQTEVAYSGKLTARSWSNIGRKVELPQMGDVVVFWRESPRSWKGHVGIFIREENGWIYTLGGNQSNKVCIQAYPKKRLLSYRRLE